MRQGFQLLRGEISAHRLPRARRRYLLRLSLNAVQSFLFNQVLSERLADGLADTVLPGDVLQVAASGGPFVATAPEREQTRLDSRIVALTGPLYGRRMRSPRGPALDREAAALTAVGLSYADFERFPRLTPGARRALLAFPQNLTVRSESEGLRVQFELPRGSYGTVLLGEFTKHTDPLADAEAGEVRESR